MHRALAPVLATVSLAAVAAPLSATRPDSDTLSLADCTWIASKIYASVQVYFAHWEGVPDLDLDAAYRSYLERATASPDRMAFDLASLEFLARLRNGHSDFNDPWLWQNHGAPLGFALTRLGGSWVVGESRLAELSAGDVVTRIDGMPAEAFLSERMRYVSASSDEARRVKLFWRPFLFPVRFTLTLADGREVEIRRGDQELTPTEPRTLESRTLGDGVPYLYIPSFGEPANERAAVDFVRQHGEAPVLIIDVRRNGGGTTPIQLIRALMDRPYRDWTQSTALDIALFGAYRQIAASVQPGQLDDYIRGYLDAFTGFEHPRLIMPGAVNPPGDSPYRGGLVLLADFGCASACEDFLMPFKQSGRGTIIGSRTRGSTGQPYLYEFDNGMSFRVSSKRVYLPDGSPFEGVGIVPDIVVEPTAAELESGRDAALARALALALGERSGARLP